MTQEVLADGICSPVSVSRIENGNQMPSGRVLEQLLERLGTGTYQLCNVYYENECQASLHRTLEEIDAQVSAGDFVQARTALRQLSTKKMDSVNLQHIKMLHAAISMQDGTANEHIETELVNALRLTKPGIDLGDCRSELFSPTEVNLLVMLTTAKYMAGKNLEAIRIGEEIMFAVLLNALIDAAENSIVSKDLRHLQNILIVSVLYAVCMGILVYLSNRCKACYVRKYLLQMRKTLANGTLRTGIADYEKAGSASYVTAFNQNFSIIEEKVLKNRIAILDSVICIVLAVVVLLCMNPLIAVISIGAMAIPSLLPRLFTKALGTAQKIVMDATTAYNEKVSDMLNGYEVIKTYHAVGEMLPQFSASARHLENSKEHFSSLMGKLYGLTMLSSVAVQKYAAVFTMEAGQLSKI